MLISTCASASMASYFARRLPVVHSRYTAFRGSRAGEATAWAWKHRKRIGAGLFFTYFATGYLIIQNEAKKRDTIHPNTYLYMKIYPGAIVEVKGPPSLSYLLAAPTAGEDPPRTMTLHEVVRAIKLASLDGRIRGLFADFSTLNWPSNVQSEGLGLAQIEELMTVIHEFKVLKDEQFPAPKSFEPTKALKGDAEQHNVHPDTVELDGVPHLPTTIAFADTFLTQSSYLLASTFDKLYLQHSGNLPLTGVSVQVPFFARLLNKLGIRVHAEARKEYKSMISQFVEKDGLTRPQAENEAALLGELNRSLAFAIGVNRFPDLDPAEAADTVTTLMNNGPYSAEEAEKLGLIDGRKYKGDVARLLLGKDYGGDFDEEIQNDQQFQAGEEPKLHFKTLPHYSKISEITMNKTLHKDEQAEVAVCYLKGSISSAAGDFSASAVVKGLKEAAENDDVVAIVVRIDSGGGDVVASDSVWHAIKRAKETSRKPVIVSFGNVAASGSYYAATAADAIFASESSVTGSIGVASLRPTVTRKLFDWAGIGLQSFFTGSKAESSFHEMDDEQKKRHTKRVDETYRDFLAKVIEGRGIPKEIVDELAGGRVYTGLVAFSKTHPSVFEEKKGKDSLEAIDGGTTDFRDIASLIERAEEALGLSFSCPSTKGNNEQDRLVLDDWDLQEITEEDELNTQRIFRRLQASSTQGSKREKKLHQFEEQHKYDNSDFIASTSSEVKDIAGRSEASQVQGQKVATASANQAVAPLDPAETAHREAQAAAVQEKTSADANAARHAAESQVSASPYGLGLVDALGGLWEAAQFAMTVGIQRQIDAFMEEQQCTLEEALQSIRQGCPRNTNGENDQVSMSVHMRLVKYPRDKTFSERVRELNKKGDSPSLCVGEVFGWLTPSAIWATFQQSMVDVMSTAIWNVVVRVSENPQETLVQLLKRADAGLKAQGRMKMEYEGAHSHKFI